MEFLALFAMPVLGALFAAVARSRAIVELSSAIAALLHLLAALALAARTLEGGGAPFGAGWLRADALGAAVLVAVAAVGLAAVVSAWEEGGADTRLALLHASLLLLIAGADLALLAGHVSLLWLGLALAAAAATALIALSGSSEARAAALGFAVQSAAGLLLALVGLALLAGSRGEEPSGELAALLGPGAALDPSLVRLGFLLVLLGFGSLAGVAPLHSWVRPAHAAAPNPAGALLSTGLVAAALVALARARDIAAAALGEGFPRGILLAAAILTLAAGAAATLSADRVRSLLGATTIVQSGVFLFALSSGQEVMGAAVLLLVSHTLTKCLAFLAAGDLRRYFGDDRLGAQKGALSARTAAGSALLLAALGLAGLPPSGIFASSLTIVSAGFALGHTGPAALLMLLQLGVFLGLLRLAQELVLRPEGSVLLKSLRRSLASLVVLGGLSLLVLLLGLMTPGPLARLSVLASGAAR